MATQHLAKLVLERPLPMMRFLVGDVLPDLLYVRVAHGKRAVARLPVEVGQAGVLLLVGTDVDVCA